MALEIWNGSSWVSMANPVIWDGSSWTNINKGEIWNGSSWAPFYFRNSNQTYSDLDTVDKTLTSIKLGVNHTGTDRRRAVVWISGQFLTTAQTTGIFTSNMVSSDASAQVNFTGLTRGTQYSFDSYIEYLDSSNNVISTGPPMPVLHTDSTLDYIKTTPDTPVNTGTITSTSLSFTSRSSANYSRNGATAYIQFRLYDYPGGTLQDTINSSNLTADDNYYYKTVTFTGLSYNTAYYCTARTYYGSPVSGYSSDSSPSNVISTYPLHTPATPTKFDAYTTDALLTMLSTGNAYNNGDAYMIWERRYRTAGSSGAWTTTAFSDSGNLLTNDATSRYVTYTFSANQTDEYQFRAKVQYSTLGVAGPWSAWSDTVRPKLWVRTYIPSSVSYGSASQSAYFDGSSYYATSSDSGYPAENASDASTGTQWQSYPYKTVSGTETHVRSLVYLVRSQTYNLNTYYVSSNFDFDANYPSVSTTVNSLAYGISTLTLQKGGNVKIVLDTSSRVALNAGDLVRVNASSETVYNQQYLVSSSSGDTVFATPYDSAISTPSSASNGTLRVYESYGTSVSVLGGTSNRVDQGSNYVVRSDSDFGRDVPLSSASGSVSYTVSTSTKVAKDSTDFDTLAVTFNPILPAGYQSARLEGIYIKVGDTAMTRLYVYVNGTSSGNLVFDTGAYPPGAGTDIYISSLTGWTPTYGGDSFYVRLAIAPGQYPGNGLYYGTVSEVKIRYSYETLTG